MPFDLASTPLVDLSDGVLTLPISRDVPGNPLDAELLEQSGAALRALHAGELDAGVVLLVGLGANFCAGGDVPDFARAADRRARVFEVAEILHAFVRLLDETDQPVVAAVEGWAAGAGLSLALAADASVASGDTRVFAAYNGIGFTPDGGMSWRLPRAVGAARARRFILGNTPLDGRRAVEMGMLTDLVEGSPRAAARELAVRWAAGPRATQQATKRLLRDSAAATLDAQLDAERDAVSAAAASPEGVEGVDAFVAKRTPDFTGR